MVPFELWEQLCGAGESWLWEQEQRLLETRPLCSQRGCADSMWGRGNGKQRQTPNHYFCYSVLLKVSGPLWLPWLQSVCFPGP